MRDKEDGGKKVLSKAARTCRTTRLLNLKSRITPLDIASDIQSPCSVTAKPVIQTLSSNFSGPLSVKRQQSNVSLIKNGKKIRGRTFVNKTIQNVTQHGTFKINVEEQTQIPVKQLSECLPEITTDEKVPVKQLPKIITDEKVVVNLCQ